VKAASLELHPHYDSHGSSFRDYKSSFDQKLSTLSPVQDLILYELPEISSSLSSLTLQSIGHFMDPNEVIPFPLHRTPDTEASLPLIPGHNYPICRRLRTIFNVEAKRGVDEIKIIIRLWPENGDLGNGLLAQFGFVLHQEVCECCTIWRTWSTLANHHTLIYASLLTKKRMPLIRRSRKLRPRPLTQLLLRIPQTGSDNIVSYIIRYADHEEVAYIPDIIVIAVPEAPEHVREGAELGEVIFGWVFAAGEPEGFGGRLRTLEEEAVDCSALFVDAEFIVRFRRLGTVSKRRGRWQSMCTWYCLSIPGTLYHWLIAAT
jgi:hypothetical protein